jgi:hypothetical protein
MGGDWPEAPARLIFYLTYGARRLPPSISPIEGEMPGRAEGGGYNH